MGLKQTAHKLSTTETESIQQVDLKSISLSGLSGARCSEVHGFYFFSRFRWSSQISNIDV